jgi:hypothetical protein
MYLLVITRLVDQLQPIFCSCRQSDGRLFQQATTLLSILVIGPPFFTLIESSPHIY